MLPKVMTSNSANTNCEEQLILSSRMEEVARIPPWIERLAALHGIPSGTQFAVDLCLEEVTSNIIRHGYAGAPDRSILVEYSMPQEGIFQFVVEDEALPFNPIEAKLSPLPKTLDDLKIGGQGIRLLRDFAHSLKYEPTPRGNRLSMTFLVSSAAKRESQK